MAGGYSEVGGEKWMHNTLSINRSQHNGRWLVHSGSGNNGFKKITMK
jgi:hypothetical protein